MKKLLTVVGLLALSSAHAQWWIDPINTVPTFGLNGTFQSDYYPATLILNGLDSQSVKPESREKLTELVKGQKILCDNQGSVARYLVLVSCSFQGQNLSEWLISQNLAARGSVDKFRLPEVIYFSPSFVNVGTPVGSATSVFYADCSAVKRAGIAQLVRGDAGYRAALDSDNDGVACE